MTVEDAVALDQRWVETGTIGSSKTMANLRKERITRKLRTKSMVSRLSRRGWLRSIICPSLLGNRLYARWPSKSAIFELICLIIFSWQDLKDFFRRIGEVTYGEAHDRSRCGPGRGVVRDLHLKYFCHLYTVYLQILCDSNIQTWAWHATGVRRIQRVPT